MFLKTTIFQCFENHFIKNGVYLTCSLPRLKANLGVLNQGHLFNIRGVKKTAPCHQRQRRRIGENKAKTYQITEGKHKFWVRYTV